MVGAPSVNPSALRSSPAGIGKLTDANDAGGPRSNQCTLILTEGDSAKSLAISGLGVVGRDQYGVFPLRCAVLSLPWMPAHLVRWHTRGACKGGGGGGTKPNARPHAYNLVRTPLGDQPTAVHTLNVPIVARENLQWHLYYILAPWAHALYLVTGQHAPSTTHCNANVP